MLLQWVLVVEKLQVVKFKALNKLYTVCEGKFQLAHCKGHTCLLYDDDVRLNLAMKSQLV